MGPPHQAQFIGGAKKLKIKTSFTEIYLTYNKLHILKVYNAVKLWLMYIPGTHHHNQSNKLIHHRIHFAGGTFSGRLPVEDSLGAAISDMATRGPCVSQNCPNRNALTKPGRLMGPSMFQVWGSREQTYTVTVNIVVNGHFGTNINNAISIAALVSGTVISSFKHHFNSPSQLTTCSQVELGGLGRGASSQGVLDEM